jgi:hypothetical protein
MVLISHRGNIEGKNPHKENNPEYQKYLERIREEQAKKMQVTVF